jgi:transposase
VSQVRRRFDPDFRAGAVRIVTESGRPIAQVARELGINAGTLANWVVRDREATAPAGGLSVDERAELARLRKENAELAMERDVLTPAIRDLGRVGGVWMAKVPAL